MPKNEANAVIPFIPAVELQLACTARAPHQARQAVDAWLGGGHPALEVVRLAASELVTNAVKHTEPETGADALATVITLRLCRGKEYLRLEVIDGGTSRSPLVALPLRAPSLDAERGRGLAIVAALSRNRWGHHRSHAAGRHVVWCHLDLAPTPAEIEKLFRAQIDQDP